MRRFKCYECGHTWEIPFGTGGRGIDQVCPQCGSKSVHRDLPGGGFGRGLGQRFGGIADLAEIGWAGLCRWGRGPRGRGWWGRGPYGRP